MASAEENENYRREVTRRVRAAVASGARDLTSILRQCEGADPALVKELYQADFPARVLNGSSASEPLIRLDPTDPRLTLRMPAPDSARSQWWFTSESIGYISEVVETRCALFENSQVVCLGAPTIGHFLAHRGKAVHILDADIDVVNALHHLPSRCSASTYDAADPLPNDLIGSATIAVLDPPWYEVAIRTFLHRALDALRVGGEVIMTFPPRLTRPGIELARATLLNDLLSGTHEILALEHNSVSYQVPRFEVVAFRQLDSFPAIPWRTGDLIHIRKGNGALRPTSQLKKSAARCFSRHPQEFRVFSAGRASLPSNVALTVLEKYSSNVSTRAHTGEEPDIWSTEKVGVLVGNIEALTIALESWQDAKKDKTSTIADVASRHGDAYARDLVERLDNAFHLWSRFADPPPLRTDQEIETIKTHALTAWATKPSPREHIDPSDNFRGAFQRDRDRVLWSSALRRLSNKTQLFPATYDDQLRQRLTHSIEVFQLATTIGTSFGLDRDLIEAGALAHDVGHTPFGHAGEHALNKLLNEIDPKLNGFNHYEHGVDVVRWLEGPYYVSGATQFFGLNLTPEVLECIIKHTYCHSKGDFSSEELLRRSKHRTIIPVGYCHLEGQAVRIADKISYFLSDLEDGIRLGILSEADLRSCQFFHKPPLDLIGSRSGQLYERFLAQRRIVLKILMEDVLRATSKRLARNPPSAIRNADEYLINHSDELQTYVDEVWHKLQAGRLHKDRRVFGANLVAARMVSELTLAFALVPELIERRFYEEHERLWPSEYLGYYRTQVGRTVRIPREIVAFLPLHTLIGKSFNAHTDPTVRIEHLVMAKDYVAGLSDSRARAFHRELLGGPNGE